MNSGKPRMFGIVKLGRVSGADPRADSTGMSADPQLYLGRSSNPKTQPRRALAAGVHHKPQQRGSSTTPIAELNARTA